MKNLPTENQANPSTTSKTVTLDADDVETLLMAAGLGVRIEQLLRSAKDDLQFMQGQKKIGEAHARVNHAWLVAKAPPLPPLISISKLSPEARRMLQAVDHGWSLTPQTLINTRAQIRELREYHLIELGTPIEVIQWGGEVQRIERLDQICRLTARGHALVKSDV